MCFTATTSSGQRFVYRRAKPVQSTVDAAEIARVAALVVDVAAYVSTVQIWMHNALNRAQVAEITKRCVQVDPNKRACWQDIRDMRNNTWWRSQLILQQPTDEAFELLDDIVIGDWYVSRADLALDLVTASPEHPKSMQPFFGKTLLKPWHGKQRLSRSHTTLYTAFEGRASSRIAMYADLPSKAHWLPRGTPCLHIEWRCGKKDAVERAGITDGWSMVDFNHRAFWGKRLKLASVDLQRLGHLAWQGSNVHWRLKDRGLVIGNEIARWAFIDNKRRWPMLSSQQIKDFCLRERSWLLRHVDRDVFEKCITALDTSAFLPRI